MRLRCVVLNGKRIVFIFGVAVLILVIILSVIMLVKEPKAQSTFLDNKLGMEIIGEKFPSESVEKEDNHINIIQENPMFSYKAEPTDSVPKETDDPAFSEEKKSAAEEPEKTEEPVRENNIYGEMKLRNETDYNVDLNDLCTKELPFKLSGDGVQVLIMHTHTTECYSSSETTKYSASENGRTTNDSKNMTAIGKVVADNLNANGIKTIHDTTVHDYPTYNNAYTRAAATISKNLEKNPGIKIVLDFHRDAFPSSGGERMKLTTQVGNEKAAQVMIVAGSDKNGLRHDKWQGNLIFAAHLQNKANEMYPGLMRNLNLRKERFNQHLTPGSLIIEVGSNTNTFEEALTAAKAFSNVIISVLGGNT